MSSIRPMWPFGRGPGQPGDRRSAEQRNLRRGNGARQPIALESFGRFDRLSFVSRRPARAGIGGEHRSQKRAPSTDFLDYRPYQAGDDFRRIDWNVYGRLGSLQIKLTEARERLDVVLVLDCSASMDWGEPLDKLTFAAQVLASLASIALARSDVVRLVVLGKPPGLGPFRGRAAMHQVVQHLENLAPTGRVDVQAELAGCVPTGVRQPLVIVASDLLATDGVAAGLDALIGADVTVLHILSPGELDPPISGEVELLDAETDATLEIGASLATLAAYRARLGRWLEEQQTACLQREMRYVRLRTDRPLDRVVLEDLRRAQVLR